jgi:hypothetical protein
VTGISPRTPRSSFISSKTDSRVTAVCTGAVAVKGPAPRRKSKKERAP